MDNKTFNLKIRELFARVKNHLLTQKEHAKDESGSCVYRAPDGNKCAVGCLIPDAHYHPNIERTTPHRILDTGMTSLSLTAFPYWRTIAKAWGFDKLTEFQVKTAVGFMCRLQTIHDDHDPENWVELLYTLENYDLPDYFIRD